MIFIKSKKLTLRSLEQFDLDFLYQVENDSSYFHLNDGATGYSRKDLENYISNAKTPLTDIGQYRLVICLADNTTVGFVDLFDYMDNMVSLGIIIHPKKYRNKELAKQAIQLINEYCFYKLNIKTIKVSILETNQNSLLLFESLHFIKKTEKLEWNSYLKKNILTKHLVLVK